MWRNLIKAYFVFLSEFRVKNFEGEPAYARVNCFEENVKIISKTRGSCAPTFFKFCFSKAFHAATKTLVGFTFSWRRIQKFKQIRRTDKKKKEKNALSGLLHRNLFTQNFFSNQANTSRVSVVEKIHKKKKNFIVFCLFDAGASTNLMLLNGFLF